MSMKGEIGQASGGRVTDQLLDQIWHALGDTATAEWASGLIGKGREIFVGTSMAPREDIYSELMGRSQVSSSASEHYEAILKPNVLMKRHANRDEPTNGSATPS